MLGSLMGKPLGWRTKPGLGQSTPRPRQKIGSMKFVTLYHDSLPRKWEVLFDRWCRRYYNAGLRYEDLVVITHREGRVKRDDIPCPSQLFHVGCEWNTQEEVDLCRPTVAMDFKEYALWMYLYHATEPFLYIDLDALFSNLLPFPVGELGQTTEKPFYMVLDPGQRRIPEYGNCYEHNAGVVWFPRPMLFNSICSCYRKHFLAFKPNSKDPLLGQKCWSIAHHEMGGGLLSNTYNWSHWWKPNDQASINHYHGPRGKAKLKVITG